MNTLRQDVQEYLSMRRNLGFKLREAGKALLDFVTFMEQQRASYRFEAGRRWVRPKSRKALRDKIREKTGRTRSGSLETIIKELNPILRGWFGYFKQAHRTTFRDVDGFVRRRLRAILRKREKRPGFGRTARDHIRWPNDFFAEHGLFTLHKAQVLASQSR